MEFARSESLKQHKYHHTGERPHVCSKCLQGFIRKEHCTRHMAKCKGKQPRKAKEKEAEFISSPAESSGSSKLNIYPSESHQCLMCLHKFSKLITLQRHLLKCKVKRACLNRVECVKDEPKGRDGYNSDTTEEGSETEFELCEVKSEVNELEVNNTDHV